MLDDFVRTEGNPEVVQFSGGEPTIHPQIIDFVRAAQARGIPFVMINTNGKRIATTIASWNSSTRCARDLLPVRRLRAIETYRIIRGEPDILEEKLRALDRLASIGLDVTLVPAIERGVNEHEIGKIIEFAIKHPAIRGINFQPAFHAGRHMHHDPMQRMTIPDIVKLIEEQTGGQFVASDFVPVPCCFPSCNSVTYAFIDGEKVTPLPRIVDVTTISTTSPTASCPISAWRSRRHWKGSGRLRRSPDRRNRPSSSRFRARPADFPKA
jgi:uncharacterized radical SAM superfamily Fe-S cluster-containing enzyme